MTKKNISIAILILIVTLFIVHCWIILLSTTILINWQHYIGLFLFIPLPVLLFRNINAAIVGTGIYLLLGLLGFLSITVGIITSTITFSSITIAGFNGLFLLLLFFCGILNGYALMDIQHDYKQSQIVKKQNNLDGIGKK